MSTNNLTEVHLYKDDFRVIHLALMECQTVWRNMIDDGDLPDLPGMDLGKAQHILIRFSEVREKIGILLDGQLIKVGGESYEKIRKIIKEEGK